VTEFMFKPVPAGEAGVSAELLPALRRHLTPWSQAACRSLKDLQSN
jgi:hypothetical protein